MRNFLVNKYLLSEVIPQFFTTLAIISSILVISQLVRLSEVLATFGFSLENILLPFLFIILPFLSFTIPMSYMFAVLIGFSRLSLDGEFTALQAAGLSVAKAARPIIGFSLVLFVISSLSALHLEPWGRRELKNFYNRKARSELDNVLKYRLQSGVFLNNFLGFTLYAEKVSEDKTQLENVMLAPRDKKQNFTLLAPAGMITGSVETSDLRMAFNYGVVYTVSPETQEASIVKFKRAEIDLLKIFQDQIYASQGGGPEDYRNLPPMKLSRYINSQKGNKKQYQKARFLLHSRSATPFAVVAFAFFAIVYGIQDSRRGKNQGFLLAILTIISGYILLMGFKWLAEHGYMNAPVAAWLPNILFCSAGAFCLYQKNRLPPSEGIVDYKNLPFVNSDIKS